MSSPQMRYHRHRPTMDRLLDRVLIRPDGCWEWQGTRTRSGYGRVGYKGRKSCPAYQAFYREFVGPISAGYDIDHTCHDPKICTDSALCPHRACVNPRHLAAVTVEVNRSRSTNRIIEPADRELIRSSIEKTSTLAHRYGVAPVTIRGIRSGVDLRRKAARHASA